MATTTQIHTLRIDTSDPPDIIQITIVATFTALPSSPTPQTAYYISDSGIYVATEKESDAIPDDYEVLELFLSDARIGSLIDSFGADKAVYKAVKLISTKLANKLIIVKNKAGAESIEYIKLLDLWDYYDKIAKSIKDEINDSNLNSTGRWGTSTQPEIAGGNL
jgi:hypothetical protein